MNCFRLGFFAFVCLASAWQTTAQGQTANDQVETGLAYWRCAILAGYAGSTSNTPAPDLHFQKGRAIFRKVLTDRAQGRLSKEQFEALPIEFWGNLATIGLDSGDFQLGVLWSSMGKLTFDAIQQEVRRRQQPIGLNSINSAATKIYDDRNCRVIR